MSTSIDVRLFPEWAHVALPTTGETLSLREFDILAAKVHEAAINKKGREIMRVHFDQINPGDYLMGKPVVQRNPLPVPEANPSDRFVQLTLDSGAHTMTLISRGHVITEIERPIQ